ncbi:MAG: glycosyltransferase family 2 protein [Oscillospiraceae bacterium]|jgi:glycosyltransferase involved in cell wall biosynthesis|nr:glycosyltransferase family 2 protein [Oscillospiraceae bacterium]
MISILLATYNGEKYIREQIDSILAQTYKDFVLIINDDKSTDSTFSVISEYANEYPGKVIVTQSEINTGGAKYNFLKMMISYKDDYIMLCDQDDVWLPTKIEITMQKMQIIEEKYGKNTPVLIHTDLIVADENLNAIRQSYRKMSKNNYKNNSLNNLLAMNISTGCTSMYNRALADLIVNEPGYFVMHDWWLGLTATAYGKIAGINEQTVLYRQHSENSLGAKKALSLKYIKFVLTNNEVMYEKINNSYLQAAAFLSEHKDKLTEKQKELVLTHAKMQEFSKCKKLCVMIKNKTYLHGLSRKIAQTIVLIKS